MAGVCQIVIATNADLNDNTKLAEKRRCHVLIYAELFTGISTRYPRFRDFCVSLTGKTILYNPTTDVLNRASVVAKGICSNANQSG